MQATQIISDGSAIVFPWSVVLWDKDGGNQHIWFKSWSAEDSIKEFIEWHKSINGKMLMPTFKAVKLHNSELGYVLDLTGTTAV
jgi:hypothetical protein